MHVNVKQLVYAGLCLAVSMVLVLLEGVFGMSTLFLLSLSGFFVGVVIRESGFKMGGIYLAASMALANLMYFLSKLAVFNLLTVPLVLIFPTLFLTQVSTKWLLIAIAVIQPAWYVGDKAYDAFQIGIWNRIKGLI